MPDHYINAADLEREIEWHRGQAVRCFNLQNEHFAGRGTIHRETVRRLQAFLSQAGSDGGARCPTCRLPRDAHRPHFFQSVPGRGGNHVPCGDSFHHAHYEPDSLEGERITVWECPRGHRELRTLTDETGERGCCWMCHPGGRLRGEGGHGSAPYEQIKRQAILLPPSGTRDGDARGKS